MVVKFAPSDSSVELVGSKNRVKRMMYMFHIQIAVSAMIRIVRTDTNIDSASTAHELSGVRN